ncbi:carbon-nitrogen hydrolase family protein [Neptuniibacter pectenicola]|uniref:carbon-nitrogen hydrolase family protein n=1 Tax=Neptuniibacter pectenicola TaxID=1806669 RepID=UPI000A8695EA|nr:carbon-nitrogen hydrolase family protein [Neptuniibacter pectenicola]
MVKVAVAQMVSGEVLADNLATVALLAQEAAAASVSLLLLPENFALLDSKALISLAEEEARAGIIQKTISDLAKQYGLWIIAGSVPLLSPSGTKVYASCLVFDQAGVQVGRYDKVHLFDVDVDDAHSSYRESDFIEAGKQPVVVESPFGRIGLSICYDVRFPEHYQKLRALGADIIVVPSAFTYVTGEAHWEVLLRARAIETQCYVLAANQGGKHSETRSSWGHSMVVDPWGDVLALKTLMGSGLVLAEIDMATLHKRRKAMPVMQHRAQAGF